MLTSQRRLAVLPPGEVGSGPKDRESLAQVQEEWEGSLAPCLSLHPETDFCIASILPRKADKSMPAPGPCCLCSMWLSRGLFLSVYYQSPRPGAQQHSAGQLSPHWRFVLFSGC